MPSSRKHITQRILWSSHWRPNLLSPLLALVYFGSGFSQTATATEPNRATNWEAGAASETLEVPGNIIMGGYGVYAPPLTTSPRRSTGQHDPLQVNALATRGIRGNIVVLAGIDAVGLRASTTERIEAKLAAWNSNIRLVLCASHSHATPDTFGIWGSLPSQSGIDPDYLAEVESKTIRAVQTAVESLRPARLSYNSRPLPVTTPTKAETTAPATFVWAQDARTGHPIARFTHWNAHPTLLPAENTLLSADYVGFYRAHSAQSPATRDEIQVFCNGYLAGVYPKADDERPDPFEITVPSEAVERGIRKASYMGYALASAAAEAKETATVMHDTSSLAARFSTWVPVTNTLFTLLARFGMIDIHPRKGQMLVASSWIKWGPLQAVALAGEPSELVAHSFTNIMSEHGVEHSFVIGQAGGMIGYLLGGETEFKSNAYRYQSTLSPSRGAASALSQSFEDFYWW